MREDKVSHRNPLIILRKCTPETGKSYYPTPSQSRVHIQLIGGGVIYLAERVICSFSDIAKVRRRDDCRLCIGVCLFGFFDGGDECVCNGLI